MMVPASSIEDEDGSFCGFSSLQRRLLGGGGKGEALIVAKLLGFCFLVFFVGGL